MFLLLSTLSALCENKFQCLDSLYQDMVIFNCLVLYKYYLYLKVASTIVFIINRTKFNTYLSFDEIEDILFDELLNKDEKHKTSLEIAKDLAHAGISEIPHLSILSKSITSCSEFNYDTDKLVTDQQRKIKRKRRSAYKHRNKQSFNTAMDRYKYDADVPSNIRHQDDSKRTENRVSSSRSDQTGLFPRASSKGKTKVPRSSKLRVNHQLKQRNHISQRRKMTQFWTNQQRTNSSRLNHIHMREAAFP